MNYEMTITLKSDLCSASGDGFSLTIDTDVCYDKYGFPVIPSRRLKGCMLEAAKYIGAEYTEEIFGVSGDEKSGSLKIGNAVLENYELLKEQAKRSGKNAQQILSLFTSVRASTAIENDAAKKESLRFMRTVNHFSPLDEKETTFSAQIECDEKYYGQLERICRATRNIGYKRSRGFGAVSCRLAEADASPKITVGGDIADDEMDYEINYSVRTNSPIMLPGAKSDETEDYIGGTSVMGFFAAQYLKSHSADGRFEEIFLKDNVIFSNLYILSESGTAAVPAPSAVSKDKTADGQVYINSLIEEKNGDTIPKPLKGGYFADGSEVKVKTETIYHHSHNDGGKLYTQTCISAEQCFGGSIRGKGKYLREIAEILGGGKISAGRSKTAQYSECDVTFADIKELSSDYLEHNEGDKIAAVFCSDAVFNGKNGSCCTDFKYVCEQLKISETNAYKEHSHMKYKTVAGYMSAGRYKKPHIRAVKAGSTICFKAGGEPIPKTGFFGERNGEGFGEVRFVKAEDIMKLGGFKFPAAEKTVSGDGLLSALLAENAEREKMRMVAVKYAKDNKGELRSSLTSSFVGRVLLMIRQADDDDDGYDNFLVRINSIKDKNKKEKAEEIAKDAKQYRDIKGWREYLEIVFLLAKYFIREKDNEKNILQADNET